MVTVLVTVHPVFRLGHENLTLVLLSLSWFSRPWSVVKPRSFSCFSAGQNVPLGHLQARTDNRCGLEGSLGPSGAADASFGPLALASKTTVIPLSCDRTENAILFMSAINRHASHLCPPSLAGLIFSRGVRVERPTPPLHNNDGFCLHLPVFLLSASPAELQLFQCQP